MAQSTGMMTVAAKNPKERQREYLRDKLVRVRVSVVLESELRRDGGHVDADVGVLDAFPLSQLVHDGLGLDGVGRVSRQKT